MSLPTRFAKICAERPDATALVDGEQRLSYAELDRASAALAGRLAARGVGRGDLVGLYLGRSMDAAIAILGVLRSGAAYVPLDPSYPTERLRLMVEDADIDLLIGDPDAPLRLDLEVLPVRGIGVAGDPGPEPGDDDPAYVIYTSGSTGRPKGCVLTHGNVCALLDAALPLFDLGPDDRWTLFHSISFDFSVWELWGALATGATVVMVPERAARSPEDLLELLADERITVLNLVPSVLRYLTLAAEQRPADLALRYLVLGGEAVDLEVIRRFVRRAAATVVNMYGITEACVHVTFKQLSESDLTGPVKSPIGTPLPHLTVELHDGEMWISGAGVARGYLNRPELTAERFVTVAGRRYYRSGDLARVLPDGGLEYLGRNDQQVKLRGFRIELGEVEAALRGHPGVHDAAASVIATDAGARFLVAWVAPAAPPDLRGYVADRLPAHMVPDRYVAVPALPRTPSGKLDRGRLG